jgi:Raf kinase inhibitor-like YbhB/YbcL family protein
MEDPDAVVTTFTHWIAFDIPGTQTEIAENVRSLSKGGLNSAKTKVYLGPCPPSGIHRYYFILTALDLDLLGLAEGANRPDIERAMTGHIIAKTQLMGLYGK